MKKKKKRNRLLNKDTKQTVKSRAGRFINGHKLIR